MGTTITSVTIAFVLAAVVPVVVTSAIRRGDRKRKHQRVLAGAAADALFTVRPRRWQRVILRTIGILVIVVGGVLLLGAAGTSDETDALPMGIAGAVALLAGVAFVLLAGALARTRIDALPDRLVVRKGFRVEREVHHTTIASIRPWTGPYGGIQARDPNGAVLFDTVSIAIGYPDLEAWLAQRAPWAWIAYAGAATPAPNWPAAGAPAPAQGWPARRGPAEPWPTPEAPGPDAPKY
ncbi:hypothetical protein [Curtobacterium herbarum]|uniref:PH domain-containing protein n=1 Tax=Curtobacterium herbarum TaxID=150122 RepID=A0ABN1ZBL2_9MICO|nr:hypothetical protein [Curtobacterium herbarum]MBM7473950.1 protein-S-isoprenylcysteine O-methyltransferase Ste14 [Curtobacterium herbarum]MCS6544723.1 hypothetical protein [Curtobacterium herbarum]